MLEMFLMIDEDGFYLCDMCKCETPNYISELTLKTPLNLRSWDLCFDCVLELLSFLESYKKEATAHG